MPFSMIASKKAAPLAGLIKKQALNDARVIHAASIQATRSFNTNAMREHGLFEPVIPTVYLNRAEDFTYPPGAPAAVPLFSQNEDENRLEIRFDMPGLGKEHVKLRSKQNTLIIKGDGEEEKWEEEGVRRYDSRFEFPDWYKLNEIEAEMKNGILKIVVPKVKEEEREDVFHQINVN